jgi:hypothetical protein
MAVWWQAGGGEWRRDGPATGAKRGAEMAEMGEERIAFFTKNPRAGMGHEAGSSNFPKE